MCVYSVSFLGFVCYYPLASFRKSTSATLSYYRHKRFSLRHIPKTAPMTAATARASLSAAAAAATAAAAAAASNTTASDTDTDTMPLTANETDTRYNNTAFVDNETCR